MGQIPYWLEKGFAQYSKWVSKHPLPFVTVPLLTTLVLTVGWMHFERQTRFDLLIPSRTSWAVDRHKFEKFFNFSQNSIILVAIVARNSSASINLIEPQLAGALYEKIRHIEETMTINVNGRNLSYKPDLVVETSPYHRANNLARIFLDHRNRTNKQAHYPMTHFGFDRPSFFPFAFGGLELRNTQPHNNAKETSGAEVVMAKGILLRYVVNDPKNLQLFEKRIQKYEESLRESDFPCKILAASFPTLSYEVGRNSEEVVKFIPVALALVLLFSLVVFTSLTSWEQSCHFHAIAGLSSVIMSLVSGMGLMYWMGYKYNDLITVTVFLALAIGVDDTFVILYAWRRHLRINPSRDPGERLALVLSEAGTSITFTSLTNVVAFLIGSTMDVPNMHDFCLFNAATITLDYLYQVTFFPAALLYSEQLNATSKYSLRFGKRHLTFVEKMTMQNSNKILTVIFRVFRAPPHAHPIS